jgi:MOSC domain-containing protein YiiM
LISLGDLRAMGAGRIVQISVSRGGVPKRPIAVGRVQVTGIEGDSWAHPEIHGGPRQAVLLIAEEVLEGLRKQGFPVFPGALGENLTTRDLDPRHWRAGQIWRAGSARLEMTKVRTPCSAIEVYGVAIGKRIYDAMVKAGNPDSPLWAHSGMYARVLSEGAVRVGDLMELESETV